jgi:hypothetical protein
MTFSAGQRLTAGVLNAAVPNAYVHVYQIAAGTQTLTTATWTEITHTGEIVDTINAHSTVTNTARVTPNIPGYYRCRGRVAFATSTVGDRIAQVRKNGAVVTGAGPYSGIPAMNGTGLSFGFADADATHLMNGTTDYISLWGQHNVGSNLATASDANSCSFMICEWVAAP